MYSVLTYPCRDPCAMMLSLKKASLRPSCSVLPSRRSLLATAVAMTVLPQEKIPRIQVVVKGDGDKRILGDCPFCHRVLLTLELKHVPYRYGDLLSLDETAASFMFQR